MIKTYKFRAEDISIFVTLPYCAKQIDIRNLGFENIFVDFLKGDDSIRVYK